jgi:hypothetical protein
MQLNQDFSSLFNSNSPGAAQPAPTGAAPAAPSAAPSGLTQDFSSVFAPQQPPQTTNASNTAKLDDVLTSEGAMGLKPIVSAFYGQESSSGANPATSVDGAHGGMQITPGTFAQFAKPGESIDNTDQNMAVGTRILAHYAQQYGGDPAKIAVAYFSGPGNVADSGPTPWKNNTKDGNGTTVSQYVQGILGRVGATPATQTAPQTEDPQAPTAPDISQAPKWMSIVTNPAFQKMTPQDQQATSDAYFQKWIAPNTSSDQLPAVQAEWAQKSAAATKAANPSLLQKVGDGITSAANSLVNNGFATDGVTPDNPTAQNAAVAAPAPGPTAGVLGNGQNLPPQQGATPAQTAALNAQPFVTPVAKQQAFNAYDAATPEQRTAMTQQPGVAGQLAQMRAAQYANSDQQGPNNNTASVENRTAALVAGGDSLDVAQAQAQKEAAAGTPTQTPNSMEPTNFDFDTSAKFANANPVLRGAYKGELGMAQSLIGVAQFGADMLGASDTSDTLGTMAKGLQNKTAAVGEPSAPMQRNFESAVSGLVQVVPALLGAAATDGAEALPMAQNYMQAFGQSYSDGRAQGQTPAEATARSGLMGAFAVIGHAAGIDAHIASIQQAAAGAATSDIATSLWNAALRDLPSTQAMALGNFVTDKLPGGVGLNPEAKFTDWLQQAGDMGVQTLMMSGMLGASAVGGSPLAPSMRGEVTPAFDQSSNTATDKNGNYWRVEPTFNNPAIGSSGAPGTSGNAPHPSQAAADQAVQNIAAIHGIDASGLIPEDTPVPQPVAQPVAPEAPAGEQPQQIVPQAGQPLVWSNGSTDVPVIYHGVAPDRGPDGRMYAQVGFNGQMSYVPFDELRPGADTPQAAPTAEAPSAKAQTPNEPVSAPTTPPGTFDPAQVMEFAQQRREALQDKQTGTLDTTMAPTGHEDTQPQGQALSPTEKMEWAALNQHANDPAALARFYGLHEPDLAPDAPTADVVNAAAHEAATSPENDTPEPTQAQKEAGNYAKGHVEIHGLDVSIENPQGSERSGTDADGVVWKNTMQDHYGYIKRTVGADHEQIDTFVGQNPASRKVFVVDQNDPNTGKFDEHKVMLGYDSMADADAAYHRNYEPGWNGRGAISEMPIGMFKEWLANGDTKSPFAKDVSTSMRKVVAEPTEPVTPPKTEREAKARKLEKANGSSTEASSGARNGEKQERTAARPVASTKSRTEARNADYPADGSARGTDGTSSRVQPRSSGSERTTAAGDVKPKTEVEARKARVERLVGKVGDIVTASTGFDYVKGGKPMRIERVEKSGAVRFVDPVSGSGTTVTHGTMDSALRKVKFEKVEPEAQVEQTSATEQVEQPPVLRDANGNVEMRPKLVGKDRYEHTSRNGYPAAQADAMRKVVDYMNGDATRSDVMRAISNPDIPYGVRASITQRMQSDGPSIGELDAMEKSASESQTEHRSLTQPTPAELRNINDMGSGFVRDNMLSAKPEPDRTSALTTLRRLNKGLESGALTDAEFRLGAQQLLSKLEDKRGGQLDRQAERTRERGDLYIRERLLRAVRQGDIEKSTADFAQWLLDKNPAIADDLGVGLRTAKDHEGSTAGMYNSMSRVVTLFKGNTNPGTAVHEILHHTERMMPANIRSAIYKAWARDWKDAYAKATPKQKPLFGQMLAASLGSKTAWDKVAKGFADGTLKYDEHYKLVNPSEYWAVKATDLMKSRYDANSWIARAKQWLSEMVQKVKSIFGLKSDAPIIEGVESVLKGEGNFTTHDMMTEKEPAQPARDIVDLPEHPTEDQTALHSIYRDISKTPTERADDSAGRSREFITKSLDTKTSAKTFNWLEKTFASQVHKAIKDPDYARVFNSMRKMMNHTGLASTRPAELAPMILPKSDHLKQSVKTLFAGKRQSQDIKDAMRALLDGTLAGDSVLKGKTFSPDELRTNYGMSAKGIEAYTQTRKAIDASLDEVSSAEAWSMAQGFVPKEIRESIINDPVASQRLIRNSLDGKIGMLQKAHDKSVERKDFQKAEILHSLMAPYVETRKKIDDIYDKAEMLKSAGYLPLMRFGTYTVYAHKIDPETGLPARDLETDQPLVHYFGMFPTEAEAKTEHARQLALYQDDPDVRVERGVKSEKGHQLYDGVSPETLALFADKVGADEAMKTVIQLAMSERSALKRRLGRRAITGYSEDLPRILSNFITSNGRFTAQRFYMRDVNRAIQEIPKEKGDVMDEAIKLKQFVLNGDDPGSKTMAGMFLWTMAGSPVSAAVIASEPFQKIFPYLSQFGVGRASAALGKSLHYVLGRKQITDPALRAAMQRAAREGIIKPQEIFHLYDMGMQNMSTWLSSQLAAHSGPGAAIAKGVADGIRARATAFTTILGMMHSAAETFGRKMAFHAAWEVATARGEKDPYAWTVRAIDEAGSQFGKINRSNIERTYAGRMMLAYKQFTIGWLGLLFRMARKGGVEGARGALVMLATQMAMGGLQGLPFMQNMDDLIDTIGNFMGHNTDFARTKRIWAQHSFGKEFGDMFMHGVARSLPVDLSEHFGMGDIVPGMDMLKASEAKDKVRNLLNVLGPQTQFATRLMDAYDAAASGNYGKAGIAVAPNFIKRPLQGAQMLATGQSTDTMGRKIAPASTFDAIAKMAGGATAQTNEQTEMRGEVQQAVGTVQDKQSQIVNMWARGIAQQDPAMQQQARETMMAWNEANPDTRIVITPQAIAAQVKQMRLDANTRALMSAPKGLKADAMSVLRPSGDD